MNNSHRNRIQSLNSRLDSQQRNSFQVQKIPPEKLEVVIQPKVSQPTNIDSCLRPIQTNIKRPTADIKKEARKLQSTKPTYKLVEDKDVPTIIKDYKRRVQYKKLDFLGSGAFGRVYRVVTVDNKYYAAKVISKIALKDINVKSKLLAEINIHRMLKHDHIVRFHSYVEDKHNIYLILDLCENRALSMMLRNRGGCLTELETKFYMAQILMALRYMSDNRVLHRDLKMSNILLDSNMNCKVGDFGLAALLLHKEDRKRTICGTPHYIAPEILFNKKGGHDHRVDMWSAGVLMFNLLFGKQPFPQNESRNFYDNLRKNAVHVQYKFPKESEYLVSSEAKDLISKLLVNNPDQRISVVEALQHPFFLTAIPDRIPKLALVRPPEYKDLFDNFCDIETSSQTKSKLALEVEKAKDIRRSFIDNDIRPPMKILQETIYDPRSQYPIQQPEISLPQQLLTSIEPNTTAKKRTASNTSSAKKEESDFTAPKRVCGDGDITMSLSQTTKSVSLEQSKLNKPFAVPTALPNRKPVMEEMVDNLNSMIKKTASLSKELRRDEVEQDKDFKWGHNNIFVETWVDCSKSYGFAYCLSDGTHGFLYNDGSTVTSYDENHYYYIYHRVEDNRYVEQEYTTIPPELEKKCAVLNKFRAYEGPELKHDHVVPKTKELTKIHLFKYYVSDTAIAFRLNNGVIQLNFFKHQKLVLYDKGMKLIFIDQSGTLYHYNTFDVISSNNKDIMDALNYAHSILKEQNIQRQEALRKERWKRLI